MKNLKLLLLAIVAIAGLGIATFAASAATTGPSRPSGGCVGDCGGGDDPTQPAFDPLCQFSPCKDGDPGDEANCTLVNCNDRPGRPEEPCVSNCGNSQEGCQINCTPDEGTPGDVIPGNTAGLQRCDAKVGNLPKVTARQINGISGGDDVEIVPVCEMKNLIEQQKGVASLRKAIANNDKMDAALDRTGMSADDVVGVIVSRTNAVLYVHAL